MGLFGNSFTKPGKGVSKEEAAKRNYFDMAGRHFFDFVKINLLFFAVNIILFAAAIWFAFPYLYEYEKFIDLLLTQQNVLLPPLPFVPFMFMGPTIAGLTYVLRNWARQEHSFMFSDFFEHAKKNFGQGLLMSVINTVFLYAALNAALFYAKTSISASAVLIILAVVLALWAMTNFYTYTIMVTFKMNLLHIIRNSMIFVLAKLPQNLFFLIMIFAVHLLLLWFVLPVWGILMVVVLIALTGFTTNYYAWHVIEKYMMPKDDTDKDESVFEDA